jgi:hypothetical protein
MASVVSETVETLTANSKPVRRNPWLFSLNGIGFMFSGLALRHRDLGEDRFIRMHWFAILFVPVLPLGIYLLSHPLNEVTRREQKDLYFVHRAVSPKGVTSIWGIGGVLKLFFSGWLIVFGVFFGLVLLVTVVAALNLMAKG